MRNDLILDLADCSDYRQTLRMGASPAAHGAAILLVALLATAFLWGALTEVDLVVRVPGRVRPISVGERVEVISSDVSVDVGGRVLEVRVVEGDEVGKGDVLLRLDTQRIRNQIAALERTIRAEQEQLEKLDRLRELTFEQYEARKQKAHAELAEAEEQLRLAGQRREVAIRLAQVDVAAAEEHAARTEYLEQRGAATQEDLCEARTRLQQAREQLRQARVPVESARVETLRQVVQLEQRQWDVQREELAISRRAKQGELEAQQLELANLELERDQALVRAPAAGIVTRVDVRARDILQPGPVGITVARQEGLEFEVAVANADVAHLQAGLPVRIRLDAYDYQQYGVLAGTIRFVAPDSQIFAGDAGPQAAAYRVKIALHQRELVRDGRRAEIKLGMTGVAEIVTGKESILTLFAKKIRQSVSLG